MDVVRKHGIASKIASPIGSAGQLKWRDRSSHDCRTLEPVFRHSPPTLLPPPPPSPSPCLSFFKCSPESWTLLDTNSASLELLEDTRDERAIRTDRVPLTSASQVRLGHWECLRLIFHRSLKGQRCCTTARARTGAVGASTLSSLDPTFFWTLSRLCPKRRQALAMSRPPTDHQTTRPEEHAEVS